jgi:hypothetical protein
MSTWGWALGGAHAVVQCFSTRACARVQQRHDVRSLAASETAAGLRARGRFLAWPAARWRAAPARAPVVMCSGVLAIVRLLVLPSPLYRSLWSFPAVEGLFCLLTRREEHRLGIAMALAMPVSAVAVTAWWRRRAVCFGD